MTKCSKAWKIWDLLTQGSSGSTNTCHSWPVLAVQLQVSKLDLETSRDPFQLVRQWLYDPVKEWPPLCSAVFPGSAKSDLTWKHTWHCMLCQNCWIAMVGLREREIPSSLPKKRHWGHPDSGNIRKKCEDCFSWHRGQTWADTWL